VKPLEARPSPRAVKFFKTLYGEDGLVDAIDQEPGDAFVNDFTQLRANESTGTAKSPKRPFRLEVVTES
jgi:hypothetical protein